MTTNSIGSLPLSEGSRVRSFMLVGAPTCAALRTHAAPWEHIRHGEHDGAVIHSLNRDPRSDTTSWRQVETRKLLRTSRCCGPDASHLQVPVDPRDPNTFARRELAASAVVDRFVTSGSVQRGTWPTIFSLSDSQQRMLADFPTREKTVRSQNSFSRAAGNGEFVHGVRRPCAGICVRPCVRACSALGAAESAAPAVLLGALHGLGGSSHAQECRHATAPRPVCGATLQTVAHVEVPRTTVGECRAFHVERYSARIDCADLPVGPRQVGQGLRCLPRRAALTY